MSRSRTLWPWLTTAASGTLLSLTFPGINLEPALWIAPCLFLATLWFAPRPKKRPAFHTFLLGYLFGYLYFTLSLFWISEVHILGALSLPAYLAVYPALFSVFAASTGRPNFNFEKPGFFGNSLTNLRTAILNAAAWTGLEWLRGIAFTGFGWNGLGVGLWKNHTLAQLADTVGVTGLSFLVVFTASVATGVTWRLTVEFRTRKLRPHLDFAALALTLITATFYGFEKLTAPLGETKPLRTLLVQLNIPQEQKWDSAFVTDIYKRYKDYTHTYTATFDFDLVIWPESSIPIPLDYPYNAGYFESFFADKQFPLLFGTNDEIPFDGTYNSIALLHGHHTDKRQIYKKIHLVPFGEYIPLRGAFPPFQWIAGELIPWDFKAGELSPPLELTGPGIQLLPALCFEDTIGDLVRYNAATSAPQLIVNVTNDGWFRESSGSEQHLANALFRCIELRRPMVRCCNTGISCVIDSSGHITDRIEDPITGSTFVTQTRPVTIEVPLTPPVTFYAKHGDLFSKIAAAIAVLAAFAHFVRSRISSRS
ncbi:MAG: apolipoprotein N-acyltransferase [Verrucomicrobiales bacterium]|nr:apolipoprotein N-acyltransferase [Verrucomicrobiales bacterium]